MAKKELREQSKTRRRQFLDLEKGEEGVVLAAKSAYFTVRASDGTVHDCKIVRSTFSENPEHETLVAVGDRIRFKRTKASGGEAFGVGIILHIESRKTRLSRVRDRRMTRSGESNLVIASNLDQLVVIASAFEPLFRPGLVDRYVVYAGFERLPLTLVVNKMDLCESKRDYKAVMRITEVYRTLGYEVKYVSAETGDGMTALLSHLDGKVSVFCGHSGVGKTSLLNALTGSDFLTKEVSEKTLKGVHGTSNAVMIPLRDGFSYSLQEGGFLIDTPGVREFGVDEIAPEEIRHFFLEFSAYAQHCQFTSCMHVNEPKCAVLNAVENGEILPERYESYLSILGSLKKQVE